MKKTILILSIVALIFLVLFGALGLGKFEKKISIVFGNSAEIEESAPFSFEKEKKIEEKSSLLFLGDVMLDRHIRTVMEKKGAPFLLEDIERLFLGQDEIIFNLEGPVTKNVSVSRNTAVGERNHTRFTFDEKLTLDFLKKTRARTVFIGNNHILDFGREGLSDTENFLGQNGIGYFGDVKGKELTLIKEMGGKKVAFVGYNEFLGNGKENVKAEIERIEKISDFVIVYTHWGTEYSRNENEKQREISHSFIDAGADIIIGSHPHVVQPIEIYKNKPIFYSLGNFIFDQYFSPDTKEGLAVGASIEKEALNFFLFPLRLSPDGKTTLSGGENKENLLKWIAKNSRVSDDLRRDISIGHFQINFK